MSPQKFTPTLDLSDDETYWVLTQALANFRDNHEADADRPAFSPEEQKRIAGTAEALRLSIEEQRDQRG